MNDSKRKIKDLLTAFEVDWLALIVIFINILLLVIERKFLYDNALKLIVVVSAFIFVYLLRLIIYKCRNEANYMTRMVYVICVYLAPFLLTIIIALIIGAKQ